MVKFTKGEMIVLLQLRKMPMQIEEMTRSSLNQFEVFKALRSLATTYITPQYLGMGEIFSLTEQGKIIADKLYQKITRKKTEIKN